MTVDEAIEVIKAVGSAVSAVLGAVGIAYARIAAKRSKQAERNTTTTQHIDGQLTTRTSAESGELALYLVRGLVDDMRDLKSELGYEPRPGLGRRRLPTDSVPTLEEQP